MAIKSFLYVWTFCFRHHFSEGISFLSLWTELSQADWDLIEFAYFKLPCHLGRVQSEIMSRLFDHLIWLFGRAGLIICKRTLSYPMSHNSSEALEDITTEQSVPDFTSNLGSFSRSTLSFSPRLFGIDLLCKSHHMSVALGTWANVKDWTLKWSRQRSARSSRTEQKFRLVPLKMNNFPLFSLSPEQTASPWIPQTELRLSCGLRNLWTAPFRTKPNKSFLATIKHKFLANKAKNSERKRHGSSGRKLFYVVRVSLRESLELSQRHPDWLRAK